MCKEPPRINSLDKVRHKQPGDREKDSDAHKSEPKVESCRPTRLTELAAAIERRVTKYDKEGGHAAYTLNRKILLSNRACGFWRDRSSIKCHSDISNSQSRAPRGPKAAY
jgi:hypothetical protein